MIHVNCDYSGLSTHSIESPYDPSGRQYIKWCTFTSISNKSRTLTVWRKRDCLCQHQGETPGELNVSLGQLGVILQHDRQAYFGVKTEISKAKSKILGQHTFYTKIIFPIFFLITYLSCDCVWLLKRFNWLTRYQTGG